MERTSGLKECPGCGLRNRQGAAQCDFCGWDFKEATDDWMGKVSDLEKLGKEASSTELDRTTRSKIELTITKPAEVAPQERPLEVFEAPSEPVANEPIEEEVAVQAEAEVEIAPVDVPEAVPEADEEEKAVTDATVAPVEDRAVIEEEIPAVETASVDKVAEKPKPEVTETSEPNVEIVEKSANASARPMITYAMLGTGLALYAVDLYVTTSGVIDKVMGWGVIIVASALIALTVMKLLRKDSANAEDDEEVLICPVCHEVVEEAEANCPSCGAKFLDTPSGE